MRRRQELDAGVVGGVSNWDVNGLVAALPHTPGRNLLPSMESETAMLHGMADAGVVEEAGPA